MGMKKMARPSVFTAEAYRSDSRKDSGASSRSSMGCVCAYLQPHVHNDVAHPLCPGGRDIMGSQLSHAACCYMVPDGCGRMQPH